MTRKLFVSLLLLSLTLMTHSTVFAADVPVEMKEGEQLFEQDYDRVWDATIAVIQEKGFSDHPHKKWKIKKEKGRIQTPEWRYFKIWSASPVIEKQYKDSYKINLKKIEIEVPQPAGATTDAPAAPAADGAGETAEPAQPETEEAAAKPADAATGAAASADGAAAAPAEATPPPVPTITKVVISIKRTFLVHNDETRKWDKGNPDTEMAGYSVEDLFKAIETKLANPNPAGDVTQQANLNITPPPLHKIPKP